MRGGRRFALLGTQILIPAPEPLESLTETGPVSVTECGVAKRQLTFEYGMRHFPKSLGGSLGERFQTRVKIVDPARIVTGHVANAFSHGARSAKPRDGRIRCRAFEAA